MLKPWKKINEEAKFKNPWWEYWIAKYEHPNGTMIDYHEVRSNGFSLIVPLREDGRILMLKMYRPVPGMFSLEFPAGGRDDGETFEQAAAREFSEEADLTADKLINAGKAIQDTGRANCMFHTFVATGLTEKVGKKDPTEEFELIWLTVAEIDEKIVNGDILDSHSITSWTQAKPYILKLIDDQE